MPVSANGDAGDITELLNQLSHDGESNRRLAFERLVSLVYGELKNLASANRYRWRLDQSSPGTTSLVHEAYARLAHQPHDGYENRSQFFSIASKVMRSVLIDNARKCSRIKRGGGVPPLPLREDIMVSAQRSDELLALDDALAELDHLDPGLAQIVELHCFGGLTFEDTADALELSTSTVKRRWRLACAWLYRELHAS